MYDMLGPHVKLILIVRDPVDRLHSDYNFERKRSFNKDPSGRAHEVCPYVGGAETLEECLFLPGTNIVRISAM